MEVRGTGKELKTAPRHSICIYHRSCGYSDASFLVMCLLGSMKTSIMENLGTWRGIGAIPLTGISDKRSEHWYQILFTARKQAMRSRMASVSLA